MTGHVDPVCFEAAEGAARAAMVDHLAACASCRYAVACHDPALLFALLSRVRVPVRVLDDVSRGVASGAGGGRISGADFWTGSAAARNAAAAAVLGLALLTGLATIRGRGPVPVQAPPGAAPAAATVEVRPDAAVSQVVDLTVGQTRFVMVYNGNLRL